MHRRLTLHDPDRDVVPQNGKKERAKRHKLYKHQQRLFTLPFLLILLRLRNLHHLSSSHSNLFFKRPLLCTSQPRWATQNPRPRSTLQLRVDFRRLPQPYQLPNINGTQLDKSTILDPPSAEMESKKRRNETSEAVTAMSVRK